ncbi:MAG: hypothetical protein OEV18_12320 [Deltaproteobacteria bacterium]|nr:hypothetical protein [Deltaproteobacteria bacterium]MDH3898165.1 hypothetical protein [Deltaproteobacteria bacterium]
MAVMTLPWHYAFGVIYCNQVTTLICSSLSIIFRPNDGREPK